MDLDVEPGTYIHTHTKKRNFINSINIYIHCYKFIFNDYCGIIINTGIASEHE